MVLCGTWSETSVAQSQLTQFWQILGPDGLFFSQRTGSHSAGIHVPFTNYFFCRWFCVVHDPKPPLHSHNWLSFGKFQDTERFIIHCERHFSPRLPSSGGTWKYAKAPSIKNTWRDSLPIDMLLSAVSVLVVAQSSSEISEGLMNNPVQWSLPQLHLIYFLQSLNKHDYLMNMEDRNTRSPRNAGPWNYIAIRKTCYCRWVLIFLESKAVKELEQACEMCCGDWLHL